MTHVEPFDMGRHYPLVADWWQARGETPIPRDFLPRLGWVAFVDQVATVAAWAVMSNSHGVAYLEWLVSNPENAVHSSQGFNNLLDAASRTLVALNYNVLFASTTDTRAVKVAMRLGFTVVEEHVTHLAKRL